MADADDGSDDARIAALEAALAAERAAREAAERALAGSEGRLRDVARREQDAIVRIARLSVGHGNLSLEDMLGELTEIAAATLGVERTSVWLLSEDHTSLCCLDLYERTPGATPRGPCSPPRSTRATSRRWRPAAPSTPTTRSPTRAPPSSATATWRRWASPR